jgi:hypothetical protein
VYEGLDAKISHYLTARTPPELFNLVFSRLENDFETKNAGSSTRAQSSSSTPRVRSELNHDLLTFGRPCPTPGGRSLQGLVGDVLSLIWVSRRGLTESELLDILEIPHSLWSPLHLAMVRSYVLPRPHNNLGQISLAQADSNMPHRPTGGVVGEQVGLPHVLPRLHATSR